MGVHLDQQLANADHGVYTYRAQGSIYHRIGCLLPQDNQRPRYLQMYIYDTDRELENRMAENSLVNREVLAILKQILDNCNPFVQVFRQISQRHDRDTIRLHLKESTSGRRQYDLPTSSQVAAILVGAEEPSDRNERDIIVQTRTGNLYNIADTAGFYDPLQYPLLHPYGNFGWDLNLFRDGPQRISTRAFYSYMFQIRPNHDSILLRAGRLLQQYVVDQYVKISTQNLRFIRDHQSTVRAELYQGLQDSFHAGETNTGNIGRKKILPASYIGSPRDMQRRYYDAMALVCRFVSGRSSIDRDEIQQFIDARWVCPHEAFWRIFAFPLNKMYPAVYSLPVSLCHFFIKHDINFL
ncbi:hypothetical protein FRX31_023135 [Thalictrum thalictroides]|uniref:Helitron helicase-like domain-containing protein n=1 Tax=Thalictrum thalictroides TaxID=46969 RepID=A0A7J6VRS3_THATH|nr:hypothetical protein FRX31_023135 [Thalictrum thalictroides]